MYDWQGRYIEQDDADWSLRKHCIKCGAFLPSKPQEVKRSIPSKWETIYDNNGDIASMTILETEIERDVYWICSRCGYQHDGEEAWI